MGEQLCFYVLSFLLLGSSVMAVTVRNIVHAAIWLILALTSIAGLFVMLNAEFLAAVQVLVYVGGVSMIWVVGQKFYRSLLSGHMIFSIKLLTMSPMSRTILNYIFVEYSVTPKISMLFFRHSLNFKN